MISASKRPGKIVPSSAKFAIPSNSSLAPTTQPFGLVPIAGPFRLVPINPWAFSKTRRKPRCSCQCGKGLSPPTQSAAKVR